MGELTQKTKLVAVAAPASWASTAATTEYICMKNADRVRFIIQTGAWAGGTAAVTLKQATSDGGSLATLGFTQYYYGTTETLTAATASSSTFNLSAANTKYVIEVKASDLNVASGYDWVAIAVASPGANADYYSITAEVYDLRYQLGNASPAVLS